LTACYAAVTAAPVVLNPFFAAAAGHIVWSRVGPTIDPRVYPWALSLEGVGRLWFGDWGVPRAGGVAGYVRFGALAATALGFLGLAKALLDRFRAADGPAGRAPLALASAVLTVALLPLLVLAKDDQHPYQFYKLLITAAPLLALGLILLGQPPNPGRANAADGAPRRAARLPRAAFLAAVAVVLVLSASASARMAYQTRKAIPVGRSNAHVLRACDVKALQRLLPRQPRGNLVFAFHDPTDGYLNSWFSFFGRRHRVWSAEPHFIDVLAWKDAAAGVADAGSLPDDALLLTSRRLPFQSVDPGGDAVWVGESFCLWRSAGGWAAPLAVGNPNGVEGTSQEPFFWIGGGVTTVDVLASRTGQVTLAGVFRLGPSRTDGAPRRVRVRAGDSESLFAARDGPGEFTACVPAGRSTIALECLDPPSVEASADGDARPLLLQVRGLSFRYRPN
jgi:hypothetical protein